MRVSLNTIKEHTEVNLELDELINKINTQLGGVEEVTHLGERYKGAVIVRTVSCERHPNADRLSVCMVDDGGVVEGVERDGSGLVQVVCGAPNARAGMLAVWLPPGSVVPASFDDEQPFELSARELRGVVSNGMLAAGDELAINDDHDGIIEVTAADLKFETSLDDLIGKSFADVFGLDDVLIDIENKMFTHRPDLFGQIGVAREVAGIQGNEFVSPEWYRDLPVFDRLAEETLRLEVFNKASSQVPRFMAAAMTGVSVGKSPLWLQCELLRFGSKSINNIVDITNYVMLMTAQPVHAYDYDKLRGGKLGVRLAENSEKLTLLNGKTYQLTEDDIVIVDGEGPIGLAGVMGGLDSEVTSETKNIVLEVATFDMFAVRKSSMRHGLFTDALTRFNKGQSPLQTDRVMLLLTDKISEITGSKLASQVIDDTASIAEEYSNQHMGSEQSVSAKFINDRLGLDLSDEQICQLLRNVEFTAHKEDSASDIVIAAPFWRTDIELPEDVVEEVGRLYGFDKLPRELPVRSIKPAPKNPMRELKKTIRDILASAGANEVLAYSFVHENILAKAGQDPSDSYKITNSLSPDLQYYRQSLTPSLLSHVHANIKAGNDSFGLFEAGKIHAKSLGLNDEGVPVELNQLAYVFASKKHASGAAYYAAKRYLDFVGSRLGVELSYRELQGSDQAAAMTPFEPKRSAAVFSRATGEAVGVIGEFKKRVSNDFKLPEYAAGFELSLDRLLGLVAESAKDSYAPLSRYPSVTRDVCFRVGADVSYGQLYESIAGVEVSANTDVKIEPIDIYQAEQDTDSKQITFRINITDHEKTLDSKEAENIISSITNRAAEAVGAEVV